MRCDAILFDLDGVLVDSTAIVERQWKIWAESRGYDADEILAVAHGRRIIETLRLFAPEYATEEEADAIARAEAADVEGLRVVPGAIPLLDALPKDTWGIVTSGTREVAFARIEAAGIPLPDVFVTADDVTEGKPAPEPYLAGAEGLGVRPERCIVLEDAPAGIESAIAAGMHAVGIVGTYDKSELTRASIVAESLSELNVEVLDWGRSRLEVSVRKVID